MSASRIFDLCSDDLKPGLVLHLDPISLKQGGGQHYSPDGFRVPGDHYFLCVLVEEDESYWVPLSSKPGELRLKLERSEKRGHPTWTQSDTYAVASQFWRASSRAVIESARVANERSQRGNRNSLTSEAVELVARALRAWS